VSEEEGVLGGCGLWKGVEASSVGAFRGRGLLLCNLEGFGRRSGSISMSCWGCGRGSVSEERRGVWPVGRTDGVSWNLGEGLFSGRLSLRVGVHTGCGGLDGGEINMLFTNSGVI